MKCKIFWDFIGNVKFLEDEINLWLADNPNIRCERQIAMAGAGETIVIVIWYEERGE